MKNLKKSLFAAAAIFSVIFTAITVAGCTPSVGGFSKLTGVVTIDGKAEVGQTLTANISQLKGLVGEVKYEWVVEDRITRNNADIEGGEGGESATNLAAYEVKSSAQGKTIKVKVWGNYNANGITSASVYVSPAQTE